MKISKNAIIALDGGGTNLRIVIRDQVTNEELFSKKVKYGTNLSSVGDKNQALENIKKLILDGFECVRQKGYKISAIGLSSAGTEVKENVVMLKQALEDASKKIQESDIQASLNPPLCVVTNDIDILLGKDVSIAGVCGTGSILAYRSEEKDENGNRIIKTVDGLGHTIGDYGSGYYIGDHVINRVLRIFNAGAYIDSNGKEVEVDPNKSNLVKRVLILLAKDAKENRDGINVDDMEPSELVRYYEDTLEQLKTGELTLQQLVADATNVKSMKDGVEIENKYDKAVVAKYAGFLIADVEDPALDDILEKAATEYALSIKAAIKKGKLQDEPNINVLLNGGIVQHNPKYKERIEAIVKEKYPNVTINVIDPEKEEAVDYTIKYMKELLEQRQKQKYEGLPIIEFPPSGAIRGAGKFQSLDGRDIDEIA